MMQSKKGEVRLWNICCHFQKQIPSLAFARWYRGSLELSETISSWKLNWKEKEWNGMGEKWTYEVLFQHAWSPAGILSIKPKTSHLLLKQNKQVIQVYLSLGKINSRKEKEQAK